MINLIIKTEFWPLMAGPTAALRLKTRISSNIKTTSQGLHCHYLLNLTPNRNWAATTMMLLNLKNPCQPTSTSVKNSERSFVSVSPSSTRTKSWKQSLSAGSHSPRSRSSPSSRCRPRTNSATIGSRKILRGAHSRAEAWHPLSNCPQIMKQWTLHWSWLTSWFNSCTATHNKIRMVGRQGTLARRILTVMTWMSCKTRRTHCRTKLRRKFKIKILSQRMIKCNSSSN